MKTAAGWSGTFSLPRELWLGEDNRLRMRPVEELKQLRYNERCRTDLSLAADNEMALIDCQGQLLDLEVEVFANDRQALLRRVYPSQESSVGVKLFSKGGASQLVRLSCWEMMPSNPY